MVRKSVVSGRFYPEDREQCLSELKECLQKEHLTEKIDTRIFGGIVPHAGWVYSGSTAGLVFQAIKQHATSPLFLIFGAVHVYGVSGPSIWREGPWETPLGNIEVNQSLAEDIIKEGKGLIAENPAPHKKEHSIEVQLPFIKYLFPESQIVPVMVPPDKRALQAGEIAGHVLAHYNKEVVVIGSTDLTHYGMHYGQLEKGIGQEALDWVRNINDKKILDLMIAMKSEEIVSESDKSGNACGAGAITATMSAVKVLGAKAGKLLKYTTSHDEIPSMGEATSFVGYGGVIFV
ncbi:MAG: AmmeMemoRadiSam system protein B [Candidatus Eremiobacterota bacterium]